MAEQCVDNSVQHSECQPENTVWKYIQLKKTEKSGILQFSVQLSDECAAQQHEYLNLKDRKDEKQTIIQDFSFKDILNQETGHVQLWTSPQWVFLFQTSSLNYWIYTNPLSSLPGDPTEKY